MADEITPKEPGRPTKLNEDLLKKIEEILKVGGTMKEACSYARITEQSYYRWVKEDKEIVSRMEAARHYADIMAKHVVVKSIVKDKDIETAKWWLEKREFREKQNLTQVNINNMKMEFVEGEYVEGQVTQEPASGSIEQPQV